MWAGSVSDAGLEVTATLRLLGARAQMFASGEAVERDPMLVDKLWEWAQRHGVTRCVLATDGEAGILQDWGWERGDDWVRFGRDLVPADAARTPSSQVREVDVDSPQLLTLARTRLPQVGDRRPSGSDVLGSLGLDPTARAWVWRDPGTAWIATHRDDVRGVIAVLVRAEDAPGTAVDDLLAAAFSTFVADGATRAESIVATDNLGSRRLNARYGLLVERSGTWWHRGVAGSER